MTRWQSNLLLLHSCHPPTHYSLCCKLREPSIPCCEVYHATQQSYEHLPWEDSSNVGGKFKVYYNLPREMK